MSTAIGSGLATLTLRRPGSGNALASDLVEELLQGLTAAWRDPAVRMVVLRGEGKHFCTGFDLSDLEQQSDGDLLHRFVRIETLLSALWHAPKRTAAIAAGRTWGAGADIVAACDFRIADHRTRFRFPGAGFGIVLGTRRLAARVGEDRARCWVIENREIAAEEAASAGLITEVVEPEAQDDWIAARLADTRVEDQTIDTIHRASRPDMRDADLAQLVRSAAEPGLRQRIQAYAARVRGAAR